MSVTASYFLFADGYSCICHVKSYWSPVLSVGGTDQAVYGSIQYVHAWSRGLSKLLISNKMSLSSLD